MVVCCNPWLCWMFEERIKRCHVGILNLVTKCMPDHCTESRVSASSGNPSLPWLAGCCRWLNIYPKALFTFLYVALFKQYAAQMERRMMMMMISSLVCKFTLTHHQDVTSSHVKLWWGFLFRNVSDDISSAGLYLAVCARIICVIRRM